MSYRKPQKQYGGNSLSLPLSLMFEDGAFISLHCVGFGRSFTSGRPKKTPLWPQRIHPPFNQCIAEQIMGELSFLDEQDNIELWLRAAFNEQYAVSVTEMRTEVTVLLLLMIF